MSENKAWVIIIVTLILSITVYNISEHFLMVQENKVMNKSGLEQCLSDPNRSNSKVIWVKDCNSYMKNFK